MGPAFGLGLVEMFRRVSVDAGRELRIGGGSALLAPPWLVMSRFDMD